MSLSQFFTFRGIIYKYMILFEAPVFRFQTCYDIMCSHGLFNGHRHLAIYHTDVGHEWSFTVTLGDKLIMKLSNETMRIMGPVFVVLAEWGPLHTCLEHWSLYFDNIWSLHGQSVWAKAKVFWANTPPPTPIRQYGK